MSVGEAIGATTKEQSGKELGCYHEEMVVNAKQSLQNELENSTLDELLYDLKNSKRN